MPKNSSKKIKIKKIQKKKAFSSGNLQVWLIYKNSWTKKVFFMFYDDFYKF